jgi:hypothetical protein
MPVQSSNNHLAFLAILLQRVQDMEYLSKVISNSNLHACLFIVRQFKSNQLGFPSHSQMLWFF